MRVQYLEPDSVSIRAKPISVADKHRLKIAKKMLGEVGTTVKVVIPSMGNSFVVLSNFLGECEVPSSWVFSKNR